MGNIDTLLETVPTYTEIAKIHSPEGRCVDRVSSLRSRNSSACHCLWLFEAPAPPHLPQTGKVQGFYGAMQKLTPGPGLCDWGTLDLPKKGFLERDCFCSASELSPPSSSSFFLPPIENLALQYQPMVSFVIMYLVIFLRVVLNMLPVLPGPFSPGGELPPPSLPSAFALTERVIHTY